MTAPAYDHVVLTRFSVLIRGQRELMPAEWLRYRLAFFYDTAYPSVTRQRGAHQPVSWLVFCDERCPDDVRETIEDLAVGAFTPVWTRAPFREIHQHHVAQLAAAPALVTTRLDSDDALAVDFLATVQREAARHLTSERRDEALFVDFPVGVQIDRTGAVYRGSIASSPFLSLIERRMPSDGVEGGLPQTVFAVRHPIARTRAPMRVVSAPPMWLQTMHGANVRNVVTGRRVHPRVVARRFDIELDYRRTLPRWELVREQAADAARHARMYAAHPGQLLMSAEATYRRARGTHDLAQSAAAVGWAERLKPMARRLGYQPNHPW